MVLGASVLLVACGGSEKNSPAAPSFTSKPSVNVNEDELKAVAVSITHEPITGGPCSSVSGLNAVSSDQNVIENSAFSWSGTVPNCSLNFTPKKDHSGTATVTISYNTGTLYSHSIEITVLPQTDINSVDISEFNNGSVGNICVASTSGVYCSGQNRNGQVGDGTTTDRTAPTHASSLTGNFLQVETGQYTTCALRDDNTVWCTGSGTYGQLGDGSSSSVNTTWVQVTKNSDSSPLTNITQIAVGYLVVCAVDTSKDAWCWGYNATGSLGDGTNTQRHRAVQVLKDNGAGGTEPLTNVEKITGGDTFNCALRSDKTAWCWGANSFGYLGDNTTTSRNYAVQVLMDNGAGGTTNFVNVKDIASAQYFTCAVTEDGKAWCWGLNQFGRLGTGGFTSPRYATEVVKSDDSSFSNAVSVDVGNTHACLIDADKKGWCWGANELGQLGIGNHSAYVNKANAVKDPANSAADWTNIDKLVTGGFTTCAVSNDLLYCWGASGLGLIENSNVLKDSRIPVQSSQLTSISSLAKSNTNEFSNFSCAIKSDATGVCWGSNAYKQLGDNTGLSSASPVTIKDPTGSANLTGITDLSTATDHACAIAGGQGYCWGGSISGIRGDGSSVNAVHTVKVEKDAGGDLDNLVKIAAGPSHNCAIDNTGQVWCWGSNTFGQIGDLTTTIRRKAVAVQKDNGGGGSTAFNNASEIMVANYYSCAVDTSNQLWCWGRGATGGLSTNSTANSSKAIKALKDNGAGGTTDFNDAVALTHTLIGGCATTTSKGVWCWGYGSHGQIGNGSFSASLYAKQVTRDTDSAALADIEKLEGSNYQVCAVDGSNSLWCWGSNKRGHLSNNLLYDYASNRATQVSATADNATKVTDAIDVTVGTFHTCYLNSSNQVSCWGFGAAGVYGDGKYAGSASPILSDFH